MMPRTQMLIATAAISALTNPLWAQDTASEQPSFETQPEASVYPKDYTPSWTDNDIALIAKQLSGSWISDSVTASSVLISIAPAPVDGLLDTLYVESAHAETPWAPYRQAIFQLYRYKGKVRLRTYEFAVGVDSLGVYSAMWAVPEYFPELSSTQLIATLDVELDPTPTGFTGQTPYPYPTGSGGAVEMTSSVTLDDNTMTTADRGYDADGNIVWGAGEDGSYTFTRTESPISVDRRTDGMAILQIGEPGDAVVEVNDEMHVHYSGYLTNGYRFDSSSIRDRPYIFRYPPGQGAITGWGLGMDGLALGDHRKLVVPGYLGYAQRGNPRANIPPGATLIFDIHLIHVNHPEPAPEPAPLED